MSTTTVVATPVTGAQNFAVLLGRLLIASLFLPAGIDKAMGFAGVAGYIASKGLPLPEVGAAIAIVVEIGCSLAILLGWRTRTAALVLAAFTLAATYFFHNFWAVPEAQKMAQQMNFSKNIAIVGGLLVLAAWGAGRFSVDARRRLA